MADWRQAIFLQCRVASEFKDRFTKANADMVFGGETQLWPEISIILNETQKRR